MNRLLSLCVGCFWLAHLAQGGQAPTEDSAAALLSRVGETYRSLDSFHFDVTELTTTKSKDFERSTETHVVTARDASGRLRVEFDDRVAGGVAVSNGFTTWLYFPRLGKYVEMAGMPLAGAAGGQPGTPALDFIKISERFPARYRDVAERLLSSGIVREESIDVGGRQIACKVVEAEYAPPPGMAEGKILRMFWVDPQRALVVRELAQASTKPAELEEPVVVTQQITFRTAKGKEPLPADLFVFKPPEGAERVETFDQAAQAAAAWVGRTAADFTLNDLNNQPVTLADLRGKVVLLDFWATWCGPCRIDMPRIDALHREFHQEGLAVLGVNAESPEVARSYMEGNGHGFVSLADPGMKVARAYGVSAIPTVVVIGKDGKIVAYLQGSHSAAELRAAVAQAGIE